MPKASDLKTGMVIDINSIPHLIKHLEAKSPSARGAATLYKIRFTNMQTGQKLDESYKGDEMLKEADCERVPVQFSYQEGDNWIFMNTDDYSQYELSAEDLSDVTPYITESLQGINALLMDGKPLTIILPPAVELEIVETVPSLKGASATSRNKLAVLSTGLEVQVPEYLEKGEIIKVSTTTGKYMSRA
jgi:elongation factor P